jgi:hypothetical protein
MELIEHEKPGRTAELTLQPNPLTIWLTRNAELRIDAGDFLGEVAGVVHAHWNFLSEKECRMITALWFAIGERVKTGYNAGSWSPKELRAWPQRRYLKAMTARRD